MHDNYHKPLTMKSTPFVDSVIDKLSLLEPVAKFMFGGYCLYCQGKLVGLICGDELFVKIFPSNADICNGYPTKPPYEGAKPCYVVDANDCNLQEIILATLQGVTTRN